MKRSISLAIALACFSTAVHSECVPGYCRGVGTQVVQTATVDETGVFFMVPAGANLGCTLIEGVYAKLEGTHPRFKEIYSTYLTAIATNAYFQLAVGSSSTCTVSYIRLWNGT